MIIGISLGFLAFRSTYASVFDFRRNHIPLFLPTSRIETPSSASVQHGMVSKGLEERRISRIDTYFWAWWDQLDYRAKCANATQIQKIEKGAEAAGFVSSAAG